MRRLCVAILALGALAVVAACRSAPELPRVFVVGLDGVDPRAVDLLMSEGKLPSFARLRREGAYGKLESSRPMLSPILWTTIATGKPPTEHGIGHFVTTNEKTGEPLPVTSRMRKTKALWNVFSDAGRGVAVIGWWATWPAEPVNGVIVSDHAGYHFLMETGIGRQDPAGRYHPPDAAAEIEPMLRRPEDVTPAEIAPFVTVADEELTRPFRFGDDVSHFKWALARTDGYKRVALHLWKEKRPSLMLFYVEATDSVAHLFGHLFRAQNLSGELAEQQRRFGGAVEAMYVHADRVLGEILDAIDGDTTLVVLSDHGFDLGKLQDDPSKTRDLRRVSEKFHAEEGILYLYGRGVKANARIDDAKLLDVAPTILALAGLPPARDMPGRVLEEALGDAPKLERIATYETTATAHAEGGQSSPEDRAILERLESLGYLGGRSEGSERNLAALDFEAGRFDKAAEAYRKLVAANPKDATLRTSLAGALGALGRTEEAVRELEEAIRLDPTSAEAHHNRAVIFERAGKKEAAIADYRTALRYQPQYEPSRKALERLTGSSKTWEPANDAEKLAFAIAERASEDARRGDYESAMKKLEEAERIAPRLALVLQYRANVAYLKGDRKAAMAALERALELEPGNALYRRNLESLRKAATPTP